MGAIFCTVVGIAAMVHATRRLRCVWASTVTAASAWHAPSLVVRAWPMIEGPLTPFLRRWPKILFLIFWRPTAVRVDVVYLLRVVVLVVVVVDWS
jgi:hypothetical protein